MWKREEFEKKGRGGDEFGFGREKNIAVAFGFQEGT